MNERASVRAIIEASLSIVFLGVLAYALDPARVDRHAVRFRSLAHRGSDIRTWLASPQAEFARRSRDTMIAAEMELDCGCDDAARD
jgi:hypothetical protein